MKKSIALVFCLFMVVFPSTAYAGKTPAPAISKSAPIKIAPIKVTPTKQSSFSRSMTESEMAACVKSNQSFEKCLKG